MDISTSRRQKSVGNCASGGSDHLQGSVSRQQKVCQAGALTSSSSACIACLHFCADYQQCKLLAAPTLTTGHVAGLPAGREAARQAGSTAGSSSSGEVHSPLCNAAASAALSCTLAAPPLCTAKQQPDSAALHWHCFAVCSRAMHTVSPNALCHAQQSSKAGFHSAAAALCPASQLHRRRTHWCMTLG